MIASFIEGRVRIRDERFKNQEAAEALLALLKDHEGVTKTTVNCRTGSLLIEYDPEIISLEKAKAALSQIYPEGTEQLAEYEAEGCEQLTSFNPLASLPTFGGLRMSRDSIELLTLLGAFVVCSGSGFLRAKGWHIHSGLALTALTAQHVWKYRRRLAPLFRNLAGLNKTDELDWAVEANDGNCNGDGC